MLVCVRVSWFYFHFIEKSSHTQQRVRGREEEVENFLEAKEELVCELFFLSMTQFLMKFQTSAALT